MDERSPAADRALLERLGSGDEAALDALLRAHWDELVRFARRILTEPDDAEDVVQAAYVRLWRRRGRWRTDGSVRALLYTITRNAALDELRRRGRRARAAERWEGSGSEALPSQVTEAHEVEEAARAAVAALPPKRGEVFRLAREEGLTYAEIAEVLGLAPQTVANHMSLALADLRRALADFLPEEVAP